ncbi:MAG: cell division protein ZapA [Deltaproteobacteria bacterium]|nr:cell division protein ZapA [Deltaproteobacteria bacterium]NLD36150.1 cell division protein ZapA [Desulfatiglans sp.]
MDRPIKIKIQDNEYLIRSKGNDTDNVYKIAEYVNEKLRETDEISKGMSEKRAAILTALNIASDYFRVVDERDRLLQEIQDKSQSLISVINSRIKD